MLSKTLNSFEKSKLLDTTNSSPMNLRQKISLVSKTLYKYDLSYNPIQELERSVIRGEPISKRESKPKAKKKLKIDRLSESLKVEHKTQSDGMQILSLPRLPFGNHKTYNNESEFVSDHFITENDAVNHLDKAKALEVVTRKFRIRDKRVKYLNGLHHKRSMRLSQTEDFYMYDSDAGNLMCNIIKEVTDAYDAEKEKYSQKHHYVHLTFQDLEEKIRKKKRIVNTQTDWASQSVLTDRLSMTRRDVRIPKLLQSEKYKMLEDKISNRPFTSNVVKLSL